jgi:hypothetical protein
MHAWKNRNRIVKELRKHLVNGDALKRLSHIVFQKIVTLSQLLCFTYIFYGHSHWIGKAGREMRVSELGFDLDTGLLAHLVIRQLDYR